MERKYFSVSCDPGRSLLGGRVVCGYGRLLRKAAIAGFLVVGVALYTGAAAAGADAGASGPALGSARDYVQTEPGYYAPNSVDSYESAALGIAVQAETVWSGRGRWVDGLRIVRILPGSRAGAAGLQGSSPGSLSTSLLFFGMIASAAICPPMMFGMVALSKAIQPHETIIAVDGERTRNIFDFENAIEEGQAGEIAYLTVLSHGRREQIPVLLAPGG